MNSMMIDDSHPVLLLNSLVSAVVLSRIHPFKYMVISIVPVSDGIENNGLLAAVFFELSFQTVFFCLF